VLKIDPMEISLGHRTLVEGGSIVTYLRQYDIPTIIRYMEKAGLTYHWSLGIKLGGPFPRAFDKCVVIKQKPLLWFTNGKRKTLAYNYINDLIISKSPRGRKDFHKWAQSPTEAQKIISGLTFENQTVLDPMMGSGTTGYAALNLKRKFIGIEIDPKKFTIAKAQLAG
jgi:site-specific DNA-methyltransferase (adenine-specific)